MKLFFAIIACLLATSPAHAYDFNFDTKTMSTDFLTRDTTYADIQKTEIPRKDEWIYEYPTCSAGSILWPDSPDQLIITWNLPHTQQECKGTFTIPDNARIVSLVWRPEVIACEENEKCEPSNTPNNWKIDGLRLGDNMEKVAASYGNDITFIPFASEGGGICCEGPSYPKALLIKLSDADDLDKTEIYIDVNDSKIKSLDGLEYKKLPKKIQEGLSIYEFNVFFPAEKPVTGD